MRLRRGSKKNSRETTRRDGVRRMRKVPQLTEGGQVKQVMGAEWGARGRKVMGGREVKTARGRQGAFMDGGRKGSAGGARVEKRRFTPQGSSTFLLQFHSE